MAGRHINKQVQPNLFGASQLYVLMPGLSLSNGTGWVMHLFLTCCTSMFSGFFASTTATDMVLDSCWRFSYKEYLLLPLGGNFVLFTPRYTGTILVHFCNLTGN